RRFYRAFYKNETDQSELAKFGTKNDPNIVLIRRDEMFDEITTKLTDENSGYAIHVPLSELEDYISHWKNVVRVVSEDANGNERFTWVRTSDDHLAHANLYMEVAKMKGHASADVVSARRKTRTSDNLSLEEVQKNALELIKNSV